MNFLEDLKWRDIIEDITNEKKINEIIKNKSSLYIGFDPSFDSLHLGNYAMILILKRAKTFGHQAYALIGGATGLIGDPSGKKEERDLKTEELIKQNALSIEKEIKQYGECETINNFDFYHQMNFLTFLRFVGKNINVNYLLEKDLIKRRLKTGISFAEFSYSLIQAYDFFWLYQNKNIHLQIGGSDQWGNITTGIELIDKNIKNNNACGLTVKLLVNSSGEKFGKSNKGAIYLNKKYTSPHEMFQFLINQSDEDVEKLLKLFTFLNKEEINEIMSQHKKNKKARFAQNKLAEIIITDIHGVDEFNKCANFSNSIFNKDLSSLNPDELFEALKHTNSLKATKDSYNIVDILVLTNLVQSKSQARRLIESKSISVNGILVKEHNFLVSKVHAINNLFSYIKKGKKDYYLIIWK